MAADLHSATVDPPWDLDAWRQSARAALRACIAPAQMAWSDASDASLFGAPPALAQAPLRASPPVARAFLPLAARVLAHRDPQRHALLYRLLWRMAEGEPRLLAHGLDADVFRARALEKTVRRDLHKMKAFVRFREVLGAHEEFVAWFEPDHHILDLVAPFFVRRFAGMRWAILTPYRSARWDGSTLAFGAGARPGDAPQADAREDLWRTYYANIFNPARLNPRMMRQEMPQKYWKHLPETHTLPTLLREAGSRVRDMAQRDAEPSRKPVLVSRTRARCENGVRSTYRKT